MLWIAIPRRGRALPLLQLADDRDRLPRDRSQNQLEEEALDAVLSALPPGVRAVVLADRAGHLPRVAPAPPRPAGLCRAGRHGDLPDRAGRPPLEARRGRPRDWSTPLGAGRPVRARPRPPRDLVVNVALCWRASASRASRRPHRLPADPWHLATSLSRAEQAVAWYWQRGWIEQSFTDAKSRFGLNHVQVGCPERLTRLLAALTFALAWLTLAALPEPGALPPGWATRVAPWGRASLISLTLDLLDHLHELPPPCFPHLTPQVGMREPWAGSWLLRGVGLRWRARTVPAEQLTAW